jgi:uncharacterized protein YggE
MTIKDPRVQNLAFALGVVLVVLFGFMALGEIWDVMAKLGFASSVPGEQRLITLDAQGKTVASPDTARFTANIVTRAGNPQDAERQNTETTNKVITYLKEQGVKEEDIKTISYTLYPEYQYPNGVQQLTGYVLDQGIQVRTTELTEAGTLLNGVIRQGANQVSSVEFFIEDPEKFKAEAREEAFAKIEERKRAMEKQLGVRLGKVVNYGEYSDGMIPPQPVFLERAVDGLGAGGDIPDIQKGSQEVVVNITVTYEIR